MSALGRGKPSPLGATYDGAGVNFAVYSGLAHRIELCLFDDPAAAEASAVHELPERSAGVFHGYLPGCRPGQVYGYRAHGVYDPAAGRRCNPAKLLLDPYARAIAGRLDWEGPIHAYPVGHPQTDMVVDGRDDAGSVPKSVVVDGVFEWQGDQRPNTPWSDTLIYEAHVKGLTRAHPEVPPELRGTYLGLAHPAVIDHLRGLGVTAVELLPIFEIVDESALIRRGLVNYWGYSTLGYFAPAARYASGARGQQVVEFRQMVKALHRAGIEVILDVVYNHSGEGSHLGPTLSLRGLDNVAYYRLVPGQPRYYADTSGCGNSLDLAHPATLRLVMDSLRYWAGEMHVDGFRFDLAPSLARDHGGFDPNARFLAAVHQDPLLSQLKLIAEPWDLGPGGYCLGAFPAPWAEWNGK
ncbi:MAG: glycogen debranching enzyme GlgX, partial [Myxococcales bacterium]|nr:glycogen debranching enzyme GlgX [Myxococcales bacterium]